jgi:hypothetical protein
MIRLTSIIFFVLAFTTLKAQDQVEIILPKTADWNVVAEGSPIAFKVTSNVDSTVTKSKFSIQQGKLAGMKLDSLGNFSWVPGFNLVDRIEHERLFQMIIELKLSNGNSVTKNIDITVTHTNRPPVINELKPFYLKYNSNNVYKIESSSVYDEDNDPIVFIPSIEQLPESMTISAQGEITWSPSLSQYKAIKSKETFIEFYVQDQPAKSQSKGRIKLEATQMDLPPVITTVPKVDYFKIKENETINIRFYLSDPNGDEDVEVFDFLSSNQNVKKDVLVKNTNTQYEFIWTPGYDFVQDPKDSLSLYIDFFVLDKTQKREVKRIYFSIVNTVNEAEMDRKFYDLYRGTLTRAWELMEQLKEKEEVLKRSYNKAKKGKRGRSVVNASLGATTGLSSILSKKNPDTQRLISTVGGTTVLTIGTLEATEVIGKSMKDLIDRLNYIIEKKNELQTKGDIFARDYSLKSARRSNDFIRKVDDFMSTMNLKGLVALELDASWEAKSKATDQNIKKVFKDFNPQNNLSM